MGVCVHQNCCPTMVYSALLCKLRCQGYAFSEAPCSNGPLGFQAFFHNIMQCELMTASVNKLQIQILLDSVSLRNFVSQIMKDIRTEGI
jgi:hypothetical protein